MTRIPLAVQAVAPIVASSVAVERIFVVWDFQTHALGSTLESLHRHSGTGGLHFTIPDVARAAGGDLLRSTVMPSIVDSNRLIAFLDKPNANVCFEIGLGLGLGKPVSLVAWGSVRPTWLEHPPFSGLAIQCVDSLDAIYSVAGRGESALRLPRAPTLSERTKVLFLCPKKGEGGACRREKQTTRPDWSEPLTGHFTFFDLQQLFGDVGKLVWTIAAFAESSDSRDGSETARFAAIVGWFVGRAFADAGPHADFETVRDRIVVLRSATARQVVDVLLFEQEWATLSEYHAVLVGAFQTGPLPASASTDDTSGPSPTAPTHPRLARKLMLPITAVVVGTWLLHWFWPVVPWEHSPPHAVAPTADVSSVEPMPEPRGVASAFSGGSVPAASPMAAAAPLPPARSRPAGVGSSKSPPIPDGCVPHPNGEFWYAKCFCKGIQISNTRIAVTTSELDAKSTAVTTAISAHVADRFRCPP